MLKIKPCPYCTDIGIESHPRAGIFVGMYNIYAVCECDKCDNSVAIDLEQKRRPAFYSRDFVTKSINKAIKEWNEK